MTQFRQISKGQHAKDCPYVDYDAVKLPRRATKHSAGYDFFSPCDFYLAPGETVRIPTCVCAILPNDCFLLLSPRSGLGIKYRLQLDNTVGIIDADYANSDNEGHIWIQITNDFRKNDTSTGGNLWIKAGEPFAQGIILRYNLTDDDDTTEERNGGFGSTDKKIISSETRENNGADTRSQDAHIAPWWLNIEAKGEK